MEKTKNQLYAQIKDLKTKKEFNEEINKIQKESDNLLDKDVAALLIVDELGRNKQNICKINDLKTGEDCTVFGTITNIKNTRTFSRKNGSSGRVVNLEISDDSGTCGLALWDKDTELVKNKTIQKGTKIKIINGYIKDGFNGIEINVGKWSLIETDPENMPKTDNKQKIKSNAITGELIEIEPTRAFFKDNGDFGFVANIKIKNEKETKQIALWNEKVKEIQNFKTGDKLEITNFDTRQKNGKEEYHLNGSGSIKKF